MFPILTGILVIMMTSTSTLLVLPPLYSLCVTGVFQTKQLQLGPPTHLGCTTQSEITFGNEDELITEHVKQTILTTGTHITPFATEQTHSYAMQNTHTWSRWLTN